MSKQAPQVKRYGLTLNSLDPALHRAWKAEGLIQNKTMETIVIEALEQYIKGKMEERKRERGASEA